MNTCNGVFITTASSSEESSKTKSSAPSTNESSFIIPATHTVSSELGSNVSEVEPNSISYTPASVRIIIKYNYTGLEML